MHRLCVYAVETAGKRLCVRLLAFQLSTVNAYRVVFGTWFKHSFTTASEQLVRVSFESFRGVSLAIYTLSTNPIKTTIYKKD